MDLIITRRSVQIMTVQLPGTIRQLTVIKRYQECNDVNGKMDLDLNLLAVVHVMHY